MHFHRIRGLGFELSHLSGSSALSLHIYIKLSINPVRQPFSLQTRNKTTLDYPLIQFIRPFHSKFAIQHYLIIPVHLPFSLQIERKLYQVIDLSGSSPVIHGSSLELILRNADGVLTARNSSVLRFNSVLQKGESPRLFGCPLRSEIIDRRTPHELETEAG